MTVSINVFLAAFYQLYALHHKTSSSTSRVFSMHLTVKLFFRKRKATEEADDEDKRKVQKEWNKNFEVLVYSFGILIGTNITSFNTWINSYSIN